MMQLPTTIIIDHYDPEAKEVMESLPTKIILYDAHLEYFAKSKVFAPDDDKGVDKNFNIDTRFTLFKSAIIGIEAYRSNKTESDCYGVLITSSNTGTYLFFENKARSLEVYIQLQKWLINTNQ